MKKFLWLILFVICIPTLLSFEGEDDLLEIRASHEGILSPPPAVFTHKETSSFFADIPKVNIITGEYHEEELDLIVAGCEPISIRRFYSHLGHKNQAYGHWNINPETMMLFNFRGNRFAGIGDEFGNFVLCEYDHGGRLTFNPGQHTSFTNTGLCHPLNVSFTYRRVKPGKHERFWDGVIEDGTGRTRLYRTQIGLWDEENGSLYQAWIREERKPNGNIIYYEYEDFNDKSKKNRSYKQLSTYYTLRSISAYSAKGIFLGSINLNYPDKIEGTINGPCRYIKNVEITGSDQRKATYYNHIREVSPKKKDGLIPAINDVILSQVITPAKPQQSYDYVKQKASRYFDTPFMCYAAQPEGRILSTAYDGSKKVASQSAPVGPKGEMHTIANYSYQPDHTIVHDAENNKTIYRFNHDKRVTAIEKYQGNQLYSTEHSQWDSNTGNLIRKCFHDASDKLIHLVEYGYDKNHNPVIQRTSHTHTNHLGEDYITRTYSDDGFNLKLTESDRPGKETKYTYLPNTNLLASELVYCDGQISKRSFNYYDQELGSVCIKTISDDGNNTNPDDLTGVSFRKITQISPKRTLPCIGLPETVEEKTIAPNGQEILLHKAVYIYHPSGKVLKEDHYDAHNQKRYTISHEYDEKERLISTTDPLGHKTTFTYDANFNLISQKGPNTYQEWTYDAVNRPTEEKQRQTDGTILTLKKKYDKASRLVATIDACGFETRFTHDSLGRITAIHHPDGSIERKEYDLLNNVTLESDGNGNITQKTHNFRCQPVAIYYPDGTQEHFTYNDNGGTLATHVSTTGVTKVYTYDHFDHLIKTETYTPSGELFSTTSATYSPFNKLTETDPEGITTHYTYDYAGRLIAQQIGEQITSSTYNELGQLTHTQQADVITLHTYDLKGQLLEKKIEGTDQQEHFKEKYTYDPEGNCTTITTCEGTTQTTYNTLNLPIQITDPLGNTTHITYTYGNGFTKTTTNPQGVQIIETHDSRRRPIDIQVKNPSGQTIQRREKKYDLAGNLIHAIEYIYQGTIPKDTINYEWVYGPGNRIEKIIEAGQKITQYHYDEAGRLKTTIKPDGEQIHKDYDFFGRLNRYYGKNLDYRYTYDRKDRLLAVEDTIQKTTTKRNYDIYNNLIEETLASELTLRSQYDPYGKRLALILPDKTKITYTYQGPYLHTITRNRYTHHYTTRNSSGKPTQITNPIGAITYTYDPLLRLETIQSPYYQAHSSYDSLGNLLTYSYTDCHGTQNNTYQYDHLNQLISENDNTYQYDSLFNRTHKNQNNYLLNPLCQITHDGQKNYTYDPNGNLISDGETTYTYDILDRLTSTTKGWTQTTYTYDPFNRRISKNSESYIWDDQKEIGMSWWGMTKQLRVLGEGLGAEIGAAVIIEIGGYTYFPIHDIQGSIATLIYTNKTPYGNYRYTAYGEQLIGDDISPWRFASKRYDDETQLLYFGRRYYSPQLGRWMTTDPNGFADGPNLYAYVQNNPLTHIDLYGLQRMHSMPYSLNSMRRTIFRAVELTGAHLLPIPYFRCAVESVGRWGTGCFTGSSRIRTGTTGISSIPGIVLPHRSFQFNNGIMNSEADSLKSAGHYSKSYGGVQVDVLYQKSEGISMDLLNAFLGKIGFPTACNRLFAKYYREKLHSDPHHTFKTIAHSRGGIQIMNTGKLLRWHERQHIHVETFGSGTMVPKHYFGDAINFVSPYDVVPYTCPVGYALGIFNIGYDVRVLSPSTCNPGKEHPFLGETYANEVERRGRDFREIYFKE